MSSNLDDRIALAYSKMGLREPFIAAVMARVKREVSDTVPTAATNGSWIRFNPTWCATLTDEQLFGLALHESLHIVFMHSWRREGRDPALWNVANDALINQYIRERNYQLPDGGVHIGWVTATMDSEAVYEKLRQEQKQQQAGGKGGKGSGTPTPDFGAGGFDGTGDLEDAIDEAGRTDMEASIQAAASMAKACGQGSSIVDRVLGSVAKSDAPWYEVTRNMLTEKSAADYTYLRPSRRHIAAGLYLPSLHSEDLGGLLIGFDTSGSMGPKECDQVAAELRAIIDDVNPAFVEVVYCDYSVTSVERFERDEPLDLHPKGGGGTRFQPVFEHIAAMNEPLSGVIYFSDLEGNLDECEEPACPVIWADIGRSHPEVPFGLRVQVNF
jgi:predicted metal-dependent peptidase